MLDTIITSKTRLKLILKFFLNSKNEGYLRGLESEFKEGSNAIRMELNRFEEAGLLNSRLHGNKKLFKANRKHPLFSDLHSIVLKYIGITKIIDEVIEKIGNLSSVYISGPVARGLDSEIIDLIIVGDSVDRGYLQTLSIKAEKLISRKISFVVFDEQQFLKYSNNSNEQLFLIWNG